jgi:hypothetical protein
VFPPGAQDLAMQSIEDAREVLLSISLATRRERLAAFAGIVISTVLFAAAAPFAKGLER